MQPFFLQPNLFQLQNVGDVRNSGLEAEWRLQPVRHIQGSLGYSYLHRESVGGTAVPLLNTPHHKVFGFVSYSGVPRLRLVASVNRESVRSVQDDAGVLLKLDGYADVGAKAAFAIRSGLDVEVSGSNLLDTNFELSSGFPEPGRAGLVQLRYRF